MMWLKQSTSVEVPVGPFLDSVDAVTVESALSITQPDIRLKKNGGAWAQKAAAQTLSHEENGWYEVTLDATDTNTLGHLMVSIQKSGALPVWHQFMVLPAMIYDSLVSGTDALDTSVIQWLGTAVASPHTAGYPVVTVKDGTGTGEIDTSSGLVSVNNAGEVALIDVGWAGDFATGKTIDVKFTTSTRLGVPITFAGSPAISIYKDNSTTQSTAGVTLTVDFDSVTGLHNLRITTASDGAFYSAGSNFCAVVTAGTVNGNSAVGLTVCSFSLLARSSLKPTVADRTLDVSAGGEAGVDWANVGSPTTTVGLSNTTVKTATDVETDTQDLQARTPAALVGGRVDANVGAISGDAVAADNCESAFDGTGYNVGNGLVTASPVAASVTTASFAAGAVNAAAIGAAAITAAKFGAGAVDANALAADAVDEIWAKAMAELNSVPGVTGTVLQALEWIFLLARNKVTETSTTQTLRNDADSGTIGASAISDDGTTFIRGEFA